MKKKNIILKVGDDFSEMGALITDPKYHVTAWDMRTGEMIDEHVTEEFDELYDLGLDEETEGMMFYYGELSIDELVYILNDKGFTTVKV